jgi:hypothetical protein
MTKVTGGPQGSLVVLQSICEHGTGRVNGGERSGGASQRSRSTSANCASCIVLFVIMCFMLAVLAVGLFGDELDAVPRQQPGARQQQYARAQQPRQHEF